MGRVLTTGERRAVVEVRHTSCVGPVRVAARLDLVPDEQPGLRVTTRYGLGRATDDDSGPKRRARWSVGSPQLTTSTPPQKAT